MSLEIELVSGGKMGLRLPSPIMVASGFGGYGPELRKMDERSGLGAIVTDPLSPRPWPGSAQPRLWQTPGGFLLNTGNQNPGLRKVLNEYASTWPNLDTPIIVRVCGASAEEHAAVARRLEQTEAVAGLELDPFRSDSGEQEWGAGLDVIAAVREASILPLLVALPLGAPPELATWCIEEGADALVLCSPPEGTWIVQGRQMRGKLYGAGTMALTLDYLARLAEDVTVPVVGRGGIHSLADVLAHLQVGAHAVQVGSAILRQPSIPWDLCDGLAAYLAEKSLADVAALLAHLASEHEPV